MTQREKNRIFFLRENRESEKINALDGEISEASASPHLGFGPLTVGVTGIHLTKKKFQWFRDVRESFPLASHFSEQK